MLNKDKVSQLLREVRDEIFFNATDKEYNTFMIEVQKLEIIINGFKGNNK